MTATTSGKSAEVRRIGAVTAVLDRADCTPHPPRITEPAQEAPINDRQIPCPQLTQASPGAAPAPGAGQWTDHARRRQHSAAPAQRPRPPPHRRARVRARVRRAPPQGPRVGGRWGRPRRRRSRGGCGHAPAGQARALPAGAHLGRSSIESAWCWRSTNGAFAV